MDLNGKRVLVVGYGTSGQAAAKLLVHQGASVVVIDESKKETMKRRARRKKNPPIQINFGTSTVPRIRFDAAIMSPGIHPERGLGKSVMDLDIPIFGELELASWFCQCPIIAITGTNGKTTTTELVEAVLRANRRKTLAAGNIGLPLSEAALKSEKLDFLAVEVSSFQLETIETFRPQVSVMMNITPDHLDRYSSFEDYAKAKAAIWKNQQDEDIAIVNVDTEKYLAGLGFRPSGRTIRYSARGEKADFSFDGECITSQILEKAGIEANLSMTRLRGSHNAENIMAAFAVTHALNLNLHMAWKAICAYRPLPHRLETIAKVKGVEFINDSKATNIDAMEKAIDSFNRPIVLIAGGKDKGFDFSTATPTIQKKIKACILIGEMRDRMAASWNDVTSCVFAESIEEAVQKAADMSESGDIVLLSPGCSSFDMFEDYEDRGDTFRRAVLKLNKI
jgi:UDP-N-acetylmuramoylalanine--D-glutamate ligase